ncbi:MAG: hypothetical protein ACKOWF_06220 [Chloroflexota bacterium]
MNGIPEPRKASRRAFFAAAAGSGLTVAVAVAAAPGAANAAQPAQTAQRVRLPIPPRLQWNQHHGYCGECSIQQAALLFGAYVSQEACRALLGSQRREVLLGVNDLRVLAALQFAAEEFPFRRLPSPQFERWFGWTTAHLAAGHPVLFSCFVRGMDDPDYDHIMLATGCDAARPGRYAPGDRLVFNDNFSLRPRVRRAATLPDARSMRGNGARHRFCVPRAIDYGCAVAGIIDDTGRALPVRVLLDGAREPNVIAGQAPATLRARVGIAGLVPGAAYVLYRYDDCRDVPAGDYAASRYATARPFAAAATAAAFDDAIRSDGMAIYRCLPAGA